MVLGVLLLGSLAVNALLAIFSLGKFVWYSDLDPRPVSKRFITVVIAIAVADLVLYAVAAVASLQTGVPRPGTLVFIFMNYALIFAFIAYLEKRSVRYVRDEVIAGRIGN